MKKDANYWAEEIGILGPSIKELTKQKRWKEASVNLSFLRKAVNEWDAALKE